MKRGLSGMSAQLETGIVELGNPLDLVEQFAHANSWPYDRPSEEELAAGVDGHWNRYQLWFVWREDIGSLQLSCSLDMKVAEHRFEEACALLARVNMRLWLGHFDLCPDDGVLMFRHTQFMGDDSEAARNQIEALVEIALTECERFFPAFMFLLWGGKGPEDALASAMLETVGEA